MNNFDSFEIISIFFAKNFRDFFFQYTHSQTVKLNKYANYYYIQPSSLNWVSNNMYVSCPIKSRNQGPSEKNSFELALIKYTCTNMGLWESPHLCHDQNHTLQHYKTKPHASRQVVIFYNNFIHSAGQTDEDGEAKPNSKWISRPESTLLSHKAETGSDPKWGKLNARFRDMAKGMKKRRKAGGMRVAQHQVL